METKSGFKRLREVGRRHRMRTLIGREDTMGSLETSKEYVNRMLIHGDNLAKSGEYSGATTAYKKAYNFISNPSGEVFYPPLREKYLKALLRRMERRDKTPMGNISRFVNLKSELAQRLESPYSQQLRALASILGILGGVFFLFAGFSNSSKAFLSPGTNPFNWNLLIGIILVVIGLFAGWFWIRGRKNQKIFERNIAKIKKRKKKR